MSQAAAILDEEMARGVLAAGAPALQARDGIRPSNPLLQQVHDLVNNMAAIWPSLQSSRRKDRPNRRATAIRCRIAARATVRAGERATISMTLRNSESRSVRLVPAATDLIAAGAPDCGLTIDCQPAELSLAPQEQADIAITTTFPQRRHRVLFGLLIVRAWTTACPHHHRVE